MSEYKCIIWDWNGTLLDDIEASLRSVNDMLEKRNMEKLDKARYRDCIGVPIKRFYERVFRLEDEDYDELLKEYNDGYLRHLAACGLSDGAEKLLEEFAKSGKKQVIVSSSNNEQLTANVEKYGVSEYFDAILGAADYTAGSKIERAENYLGSNGFSGADALVIGDLEHDFQMAEQIGADCILLKSGHEKPERLLACGARLVDSLSEISSRETV